MASLSTKNIATNSAIKGLAFPIAASVIAGATTMFVPTAILESFTGATGLSEIFPATAAPLGDTARALIAFSSGALTLAVTAIVSNRKGPKDMAAHQFKPVFTDNVDEVSPSMAAKLMERLSEIRKNGIGLPAMPWRKSDNGAPVVRNLGDLPKIRNADSHPDAPARRPLSAELDLSTFASEAEAQTKIETPTPTPSARFWNDEAAKAEPSIAAPAPAPVAMEPDLSRVYVPKLSTAPEIISPEIIVPEVIVPEVIVPEVVAPDAMVEVATAQTPLNELVAQLEAAVNQRQEILSRLASAQSQMSQQRTAAESMAIPPVKVAESVSAPEVSVAATVADTSGYIPPYFDRPPLEAVPSVAKAEQEAPQSASSQEDEALNAALATLRRMNANG
jgi:hypothetical protein